MFFKNKKGSKPAPKNLKKLGSFARLAIPIGAVIGVIGFLFKQLNDLNQKVAALSSKKSKKR